ncbi:MAG: hypothetical protein IJ204_09420 [Paludibacteraceae bacterium]|nr:hypothetical protein [Paludibacteraceae bacterium]
MWLICMCLVCVPSLNAAEAYHISSSVRYASSYKPKSTSAYLRPRAIGHAHHTHSAMAQAPVVSMRSTSTGVRIATTSSASVNVTGCNAHVQSGALAMNTASPSSRGTLNNSVPVVSGFRTVASNVSGGVLAAETPQRAAVQGRRKAKTPDDPDACSGCDWVWVDDLYGAGRGGYVCSKCGEELKNCEGDCGECGGECHCKAPLGMDEAVMLFFVAMAAAYGAYKKRTLILQ